jgi:hypothetical protein
MRGFLIRKSGVVLAIRDKEGPFSAVAKGNIHMYTKPPGYFTKRSFLR